MKENVRLSKCCTIVHRELASAVRPLWFACMKFCTVLRSISWILLTFGTQNDDGEKSVNNRPYQDIIKWTQHVKIRSVNGLSVHLTECPPTLLKITASGQPSFASRLTKLLWEHDNSREYGKTRSKRELEALNGPRAFTDSRAGLREDRGDRKVSSLICYNITRYVRVATVAAQTSGLARRPGERILYRPTLLAQRHEWEGQPHTSSKSRVSHLASNTCDEMVPDEVQSPPRPPSPSDGRWPTCVMKHRGETIRQER
ncbi:hypothetical protein EVAR_47323_1 [Eumeta japonica]|uniref:Uncharacterized protein n=1 Tax=Eumeta variegata TaxID=151549 RepID=A0A4C1YGK1_EUMVA|nr:hypothetical protein EVAR_47323_1 [Eumeta japonica]